MGERHEYLIAVGTSPGEKSYLKIIIDVINENMIIIEKLIIEPNFIFLYNAIITINEIQWYCISVAKYQV